jgi:glutamine amidotransferase-like uncharacterized protein
VIGPSGVLRLAADEPQLATSVIMGCAAAGGSTLVCTVGWVLLRLVAVAAAACPIRPDTQVVYSKATGVGGASIVWVEDLLWWLRSHDPTFTYQGLVEQDVQSCELRSFRNLRLYINPGGNAYNQLSALGANGTRHIREFIERDAASMGRSAYAGFCAGAYMAATGYVWETMYEGPGYFNFKNDPPLGVFPHLVEGSLVDIGDDQYSDQFGHKYRVVNVSNGHQMLYFGGSSFGFNAVADVTDPASALHDPEVEVVLYYQDFYGSAAFDGGTFNLPAAWRRKNLFLTSIHSEADNCTRDDGRAGSADCTPAGTIPHQMILRNRAWLLTHLNRVAGTSWQAPQQAPPPNMSTAKPHTSWPSVQCAQGRGGSSYGESAQVIFCDDFDSDTGEVAHGLWQWQRNQSFYNTPQPWNTTYIDSWCAAIDIQCDRPYIFASRVPTAAAVRRQQHH